MYYIIALSMIGLAALAYAYWIEPGLLVVRPYKVEMKKKEEKVAVSKGRHENALRVVFFSDLHVGPFFQGDRLNRLSKRIEKIKPDLILFGGDLVTEESDVKSQTFQAEVVAFFKGLIGLAPVLAVYGNHDVEDEVNTRLSKRIYAQTGVTLLNNDTYTFKSRIKRGASGPDHGPRAKDTATWTTPPLSIYGSDEGLHGKPRALPAGFFGLVVCHQPDIVPGLIEKAGPVLALSGHTHRGQVTFAGLPIVKVPLGRIYTYGLYVFNRAQSLLVSGGVGTVHLPFRFGARPELIELSIRLD